MKRYEHSNANSTNETCNDEHGVGNSTNLQSRADNEDGHGNHDTVLSRKGISSPALVQGAQEGTECDHGRHEALVESRAGCRVADFGESLEKVVHDQGYRYHTLTTPHLLILRNGVFRLTDEDLLVSE